MLTKKLIDFMGLRNRRIAAALSIFFIIASLILIVVRGLNLGIDFTGGTVMEVAYPSSKAPDEVRQLLAKNGYQGIVQNFGSSRDIMIRLTPKKGENNESPEARAALSEKMTAILKSETPNVEVKRVDFVGPQVGDELREQGGLAFLVTLGGIMLYVAFRFEYRFAVAAIASLLHDAVVTVGFFALTQLEFDLSVLAAVLAILGYSINDTIVIFDRERENFRKLRTETVTNVLNISINETLVRTIMTSFATLIVVVAIYVFGSDATRNFSLALIVGIISGVYSTIYIASSMLITMGISKESLIPPERKDEELDAMP
ncbi:protein translocase subunit SecF [Thiolinea disciformis]|uniref:protein translocase subunit SecF n=1 Tax=Thiolinea disciformis TaxID=125614 RepID=UPI00036CF6AB|nr:protein translocase subunit SecF [Thiolinea disciformis]